MGPAAHPRTLAPPRTPRSSSGARGGAGAIDFIVALKKRYPKGTLAHACFGRALAAYAASPRDAAAAQALSQEVQDIFVAEPGLVAAFQSFFRAGRRPEPHVAGQSDDHISESAGRARGAPPKSQSSLLDVLAVAPPKSPSLLDVLVAAPPPLGARVNGKGETIVRLKVPRVATPTDKYDLVGREVRKPYSEWCYSEWHFGTVSHMSKPGHYVIAWDERTGSIEYAASKVVKFLSPDSRETEDKIGHRKHATFQIGARVEAWWGSVEGRGGDWYDAVITYASDVCEVEWVDDPGVFNRVSHEAVRAKGSARPAPAEPPNAFAMLGFNAPTTGSGRAAAQEAARRIASHDFQ